MDGSSHFLYFFSPFNCLHPTTPPHTHIFKEISLIFPITFMKIVYFCYHIFNYREIIQFFTCSPPLTLIFPAPWLHSPWRINNTPLCVYATHFLHPFTLWWKPRLIYSVADVNSSPMCTALYTTIVHWLWLFPRRAYTVLFLWFLFYLFFSFVFCFCCLYSVAPIWGTP